MIVRINPMHPKFFYSFAAGYVVSMLTIYLISGYFSLSFTIGSFIGIALFGLGLHLLKTRKS